MAQSGTLKKQVREYIITHPSAKNKEIVDALGVAMRTVSLVRANLREEGMPPALGDKKSKEAKRPAKKVNAAEAIAHAAEGAFDVQTTADLNKAVGLELEREAAANAAADAELGPDGEVDISRLKRVLWRVVHRNVDDRIVVAAAGTLARIQQESTARTLGPGKPTTEGEVLDRLGLMFKPVGIRLVFKAMTRTFSGNDMLAVIGDWLNAEKAASQSSVVAPAPSAATRTADNETHIHSNP